MSLVGFGLPAGIAGGVLDLKAGEQAGGAYERRAISLLPSMAERWLVTISTTPSLSPTVARWWSPAPGRDIGTHGEDAVMQATDEVDDLAGIGGSDHLFGTVGGFHRDLQIGIEGAKVGADIFGILATMALSCGSWHRR